MFFCTLQINVYTIIFINTFKNITNIPLYSFRCNIIFFVVLLLYISSSVSLTYCFFILSVSLSAYSITLPSTFLAALPIVCTNDLSDLKKPSLSASNIATKAHSGISKPSLSKLIPLRRQTVPFLGHG